MTIQFKCEGCLKEFVIPDDCAGKRAKCTNCGKPLRVPFTLSTPDRSEPKSIEQLSPKDMVEELHRRGQSAVLYVFDRPADGNYALNEVAGVSIKCHGSDDMTEGQLNLVVQSVARIAAQQPKSDSSSSGHPSSELYEFKGDQLGVSLHEFKRKYYRIVPGHDKSAPFSSDQRPNSEISTLLAEKWHTSANIVHCSIEFPFERTAGMAGPTVAGIEADLLLYKFVDEQLFRISAYFDTRSFEYVRQSVREKYGKPDYQEKKPMHFVWANGTSTINLIRGRINPKEWSMLHFTYDKLFKVVHERSPKRVEDL